MELDGRHISLPVSGRRAGLTGVLACLSTPATARAPRGLWFDPTQLPSYSGRMDRWMPNPGGETDRGLFRERAQFVFQPAEAEFLAAAAAERGVPLTVWGIRARSAPVITMLAWSRNVSEGAMFVDRPSWFPSILQGTEEHSLTGKILAPLLTPQGESMGMILAEGGVVRLAAEVRRALGDRLATGEMIAAEGRGKRVGKVIAIDADKLGHDASSLAPLPDPTR